MSAPDKRMWFGRITIAWALIATAILLLWQGERASPELRERPPQPDDLSAPAEPAHVEDLQALIRAYAFADKPKLNPKTTCRINEFRVPGLQGALKARVFLVEYVVDGQAFNETLLVCRNGRVQPFGRTFGGHGLMSGTVAGGEFFYTYSWGSGGHYSHVGRMDVEGDDLRVVETGQFLFVDLFVRNDGDEVVVESGRYGSRFNTWTPIARVGRIELEHKGSLRIINASGAFVEEGIWP